MTTKTAQNKNTIQKAVTKRGAKTTYPEIAGIAESLNIDLEICGKDGRKMIEDYIIENYKGELVPVSEKTVNLSTVDSKASEADFKLKTGESTAMTFTDDFQKAAIVKQELAIQKIEITNSEALSISATLENNFESSASLLEKILNAYKQYFNEKTIVEFDKTLNQVTDIRLLHRQKNNQMKSMVKANFELINNEEAEMLEEIKGFFGNIDKIVNHRTQNNG